MIKNQKQLYITESKLIELNKVKEDLESKKSDYEPLQYELAENATIGLIEDLNDQIQTYKLKKIEKIKNEKKRIFQLSLFITNNFSDNCKILPNEEKYSKYIRNSSILKNDASTLTEITDLNIEVEEDSKANNWNDIAEIEIGNFIDNRNIQ